MIPFGETVQLWRGHRNLTQAQLAQAARIPRPNLSAIERGKREVSLSTLRALALALDVQPGVLVDGQAPGPVLRTPLSRDAMERIADAVVFHRPLRDPAERVLVNRLGELVKQRRRILLGRRNALLGKRDNHANWLLLRAACPADVLRSLLERIDNRLRVHGATAD